MPGGGPAVPDGDEPVYSGTSGFRGLVPAGRLAHLPEPGALQFWMGPGAHLLHYPIIRGTVINFLAVIDTPPRWTAPAWMEPAEPGAHQHGGRQRALGRDGQGEPAQRGAGDLVPGHADPAGTGPAGQPRPRGHVGDPVPAERVKARDAQRGQLIVSLRGSPSCA